MFTLYTPHCTLHTPHVELYTPHSILCPPHHTLHTQHVTLHTPHSTLQTPFWFAFGFVGLSCCLQIHSWKSQWLQAYYSSTLFCYKMRTVQISSTLRFLQKLDRTGFCYETRGLCTKWVAPAHLVIYKNSSETGFIQRLTHPFLYGICQPLSCI